MRYEDASGSIQATGPIANDDSDTLAAGSRQPATGNLITGEGTQYGSAGADSAAGGQVTSIAGKGGEDSSFAGGKLSVTGEHGSLSVDAKGNYSYLANKGAPENVRDRFTYTLADNQGNSDTAALIIELGKTPVVIKADAQQIVPGPDGVVTLPPGVELSDIMVVGRNLVINMPDGTQLIIIDGAVFVPQLAIDGVQIPATNVAALLIGQEPQPAAGELPPSSGGNFALPPPPLDPGVPLGDLIPPLENNYIPPEPQEVLDQLDRDPEITIQPDGQPASVNAVDVVDEAGLPTRNGGEPEGSGEGADGNPSNDSDASEATSGTIIIDSPDGVDSVTINGVLVTGAIGQEIPGDHGTLTITGFNGDDILYSYVLDDNTSGDATQDDFSVILTDDDGDTATATLTIDIIDDVPTARNDTDAVVKGDTSTDGNVMTAIGTTSSPAGADTVGADDAELTGVHAGTSGSFTAVPDAGVTVNGTFGELTIHPDGSYTYTLHAEVGDGGNDVFTYQLTDGDGDTSSATLTITVPPDLKPTLDAPNVGEAGTVVDEAGLPARDSEPEGTGEEAAAGVNGDPSESTTGTITFAPGDTPSTITINGVAITGIGDTFSGDYGTLTITAFDPNGSITYSYVLEDNVDHDTDLTPFEEFDIEITDSDGDTATDTLRIDIVDDAPIANDDTDSVTEDGPLVAEGNVVTGVGDDGNPAGDDLVGADDSIVTNVDGLNPGVGSITADGDGETIVGQYGTLVIFSDGSYEYTLDNANPVIQAMTDGDTLTEQFEYTLLDGDGDTDTAILTITINGDNDVPTVLVPTRQGPGTQVSEVGLPPRGSEPPGTGEIADGNPNNESDDSEITSGTVTYVPGDGPTTITIDGVAITGPFPQSFAGDYGTLVITAHDPVAHTISYTYTLEDNVDHDSDATPFESFDVVVADSDGNPADDATGTFIIDIFNDAPIARDDTDSVVEGQSTTGNVLTGADTTSGAAGADTPGADNFAPSAVVGVVSGGNDAVDTNNPATVGVAIVGTYGTLTLNANGTYTYQATAVDPPENAQDVFTYTVIDNDGNMDSATLTIDVIDDLTPTVDAPNIGAAGTVVDEAGLPPRGSEPPGTGENADGNPTNESDDSEITSGVINFTLGDTPSTVTINGVVVTGVGQTFAGDYGTLEITAYDPTGSISYTYTLEENVDHDTDATPFEEFEVIVTDDDGDSASDTLTINIVDDTPIAVDDTDSIASGQFGPATGNVITDAEGDGGEDNVGADDAVVVGVAPGDTNTNLESAPTVGAVVQGTYGKLTLNADGSYSYTRDANTPGGVQDVFTYTIEDGDGDQTNATLTITIGDSEPDVPENTNVGLDDDALTGGNPGGTNDDPNAVNTSGSVAAVGGDGTITYALSETGAPSGFTYDLQPDGSLHILQGTTHVLTVTLNSSGNYTVSQVAPILHDPGDTENNETFVVTFSATDLDGGSDEGTLTISVDDDTPVNFTPVSLTDVPPLVAPTQDDALVNDGTANVTRLLNDPNNDGIGTNFIGADGFGSLYFTGTPADDGTALTNTGGTPLTAGGDPIYLFGFGTDTLYASTDPAFDPESPTGLVFTVTLNEGAGYGSASTYTINFDQPIDDGSGFVFDDFSTAPAGQNDWVGLDADGLDINDPTDPNANSEDLLLTPTNAGGSINTSATDIGNANQWIDTGEGIRLDYVVDVRRDPGSDEKDVGGYAFDGHYNVTDSSFTIMQTQGGATAAVRITAFNDPDTGTLDTLSGAIVPIDPASIVVTGDATYTVTALADGSVVISGLAAGASIEFEAVGDVFFNSYSITNANGVLNPATPAPADTFTGDAFAVGVFGFNSETAGSPVPMSFDVTAEDADGDTSTGTIDVTLVPADSSSLATLAATSEMADTSSLSLLASDSQELQLQKTAANSNTLTLAAAVAAAGLGESAAAEHGGGGRGHIAEFSDFAAPEVTDYSVSDDGGDSAVSMLVAEPAVEESAPDSSSSSSSSDNAESGGLDGSTDNSAPESNDAPAGDSGSEHSSAETAGPVAPSVSMPSAEALADAANDNGNAQQGGSVEQIVAEALGEGDAPTVDEALANLPGGNGELAAISHMASPQPQVVSGWDMGSHGPIGAGFDMMFKMDVANIHHDAVQPVANG